jgi:hypothetical protein
VAKHHISASLMRSVVLGQQMRMGLHIIIEEEKNVTTSNGSAPVASGSGALIRLFENRKRERRSDLPERLRRAVFRAIHYNNNLKATVKLLVSQRTD